VIFNPEFRELIRATHRPPQRHRAQRRSLDQDGVTVGLTVDGGPLDDPDDEIDPDDLTKTEPIRCTLLLPPPVKPETWWTALVLGRENDAVSLQDVSLALGHVAFSVSGLREPIRDFPVRHQRQSGSCTRQLRSATATRDGKRSPLVGKRRQGFSSLSPRYFRQSAAMF
jgi:hypothetical protein